MDEEIHPVKEYLFDYIKKSEKNLQELLSQSKMDEVIEDILENCYYKTTLMDDKEESLGVLATGILHYMLTNAMITSQRKVEHNGIEVDIVIPDLKTLEQDAKKTLIICIPKTADKKTITEKLEKIHAIQPEKQNVWLVLSQDLGFENKTFVIQKDDNFSKIIFEIAQFVNVQGHNKFKILRI
jgi:ribosomal protein L23